MDDAYRRFRALHSCRKRGTYRLRRARDIADKLLASLSSYPSYYITTATTANAEFSRKPTMIPSAAISPHLLHGEKPTQSWEKAMAISLVLYAEHEFNAFDVYQKPGDCRNRLGCLPATSARLALRGPETMAWANEVSLEIQQRYETPDEKQRRISKRVENKEVVFGFDIRFTPSLTRATGVIAKRVAKQPEEGGSLKMRTTSPTVKT